LNCFHAKKGRDGLVMETNYKGNCAHDDPLFIGEEYQDFITNYMSKNLGISITIFKSKKYQYNIGETVQGVEIKYDARSTGDCTYKECKASGNVGIEVAEKTNASNMNFIESGIYRNDNSWLYIVGNYDCAWIFNKNLLKILHVSNRYTTVQTLPTMKSMLLPIEEADKYCAKKLIFK